MQEFEVEASIYGIEGWREFSVAIARGYGSVW